MKGILLLIGLVGVLATMSACSSTTPPRTKWQQGYSAGMADSVKRQYFAQRNLYKYEFDRRRQNPGIRRYSFVISPDPNAAEKMMPYTITIPVEQ